MDDLHVQHEPAAQKFFVELEESEAYLLYRMKGKALDLYSTYVPNAFRGKGIAGKLVEEAFAYARENGYKVHPTCPYVSTYMEQHEEHEDLKA